MSNLIASNQLTMSSRDISTYTGKSHSHVIRDIKKLYSDLYKDDPSLDDLKNIGIQVKAGVFVDVDIRGYVQYFELDRKHTDCLLTGYSAVARMKVIERWYELEFQQAPKLPQTFAEALQLAADQAKQLELAAPKVAFVDRYVESTGNKGFRQVAKLLKAKEYEFRDFLCANKIMYKLGREWTAYQNHVDAGRFKVSTGTANEHAYNAALFTPKGVEWIAGLWAVHQLNIGK